MKNQSERGSVLIGVIVSLSLAAFLYVSSSSSFFKTITRQKSKNQLDVLSKSLNNAVFNYTAYALKERWCMDSSWGRDLSCNGMSDMKQFVTHPRNLERFLWSSNTVNDLALRYQKLYGAPPAGLSLDKIEQVISMASLESLGSSHPLNLVMNDLIKQCLTSIKVSIEKPLSSYYKSQGDEIYLLITVTGNLVIDPLNNCSLIKNTPVVKGLVIVYPKTLNQYSVIKTGSFNVSDFPRTDQGLNFHGPVYVQRNIKLSSKGKFGVSFKDKVNIGEGVVQLDGVPFSPKTPGGFSDQFLSQLQTTNGFMNGISLEAEPDLGIPRLFDKNYTYPLDPNKALCANRKNLKDNFILSRDSRLWVKGNDGNYTFTLSGDNEFRECVRHGQKDGKYIYNKYDDSFASKHKNIRNTYNVELLGQAPTTKPVMEAQIFINGVNFSTIYLGRTSDAKITFGDKNFFQNQKDLLDTPETTFLNIGSIDKDGLGINNDLKKE